MCKGKELSQIEKGQIDVLRQTHPNWTHQDIANVIKRSRSTITKYLLSPETYGMAKRPGRPKKTTERDDRAISRKACSGKMSCADIVSDLELDINRTSVWRRLASDPNIKFGKHKSKPPLTERHKAQRLQFAIDMVSFPADKWADIVWSDEKKWNLDGPDGLRCYWHDLRHEREIFSRRHGGGKGSMVWAGFAANGKTEIAFTDKKLDSYRYQDLLDEYLSPVAPLITSGDYVFMQDNAPAHRSWKTKDWFVANNVKVLPWPAISPDLNPIENLWGVLTLKVYAHGRQFQTNSELEQKIVETWSELPGDLLQSLVTSMKDRMIKVIQVRGGSIDY